MSRLGCISALVLLPSLALGGGWKTEEPAFNNGGDRCVLVMPFDDGPRAWDYSHEDHHGTVSGATYVDAGGVAGGGCYGFDGNDYVDLGAGTPLIPATADWTIAVVVSNSSVGDQVYLSQYTSVAGNGRLLLYTTPAIRLFLGNQGTNGTVTWTIASKQDGWNVVIVGRSGADFRAYCNGTFYSRADSSSRQIQQTGNLLGARTSSSTYNTSLTDYLDGCMDYVAVWRRRLSDAEMMALYERLRHE